MKEYRFVRDIFEYRGVKIGASEVPCLFPDPERPSESVAGYGKTAMTLYLEKIGEKQPDKAGLAAEMGHYLEPKAIELFIRGVWGKEIAEEWMRKRMDFEMNGGDARAKQAYPILFNTAFIDKTSIVHPDGLHVGEKDGKLVRTDWGFKVDTRKDFLLEAKSASFFSARRGDSEVRGYDRNNKTWQGIPLKNWFQTQYQMLKAGVNLCYLLLLSDTSKFDVWEIKADREMQRRIANVVSLFMASVERHEPPKALAMNIEDIKILFPSVTEDFSMVIGEEGDKVKELSDKALVAAEQERVWKAKKDDALSALSVYLKDMKELRDEDGDVVCRWQTRAGVESVVSFKDMQRNDPNAVKYLRRRGLIRKSADSRYVVAKYRQPVKEQEDNNEN